MILRSDNTFRLILSAGLFVMLSFQALANKNADIHIPFEVIQGLTIIQADVDGMIGNYLLDTGSDGVFLDGAVHSESKDSIVTLGGHSAISIQKLNQLKIGNFIHSDLEAQIMSLSPIEDHLGIDLKGIIGGHLFLPRVVRFDFDRSIITLSHKLDKSEKEQFENKINIYIINDVPIAKVHIEGRWYHFALDSGSSIHFVDPEVLEKISTLKKTTESSTVKCLADSNKLVHKKIIKFLSIGNSTFNNQLCLPHSFENVNNTTATKLDGILSISQLSLATVIIDYSRSKMYF